MSKDTGSRIKTLYLDGVKQGEIARRLDVSRQVVSYHLSDKTKRHRAGMSVAQREALRAHEREKYQQRRLP